MQLNRHLIKFWMPPLVWMLVIFSGSGDAHSAHRSSRFFVPLMRWLFPRLEQMHIEAIHYLLRKGAHLTEFAVLALLLWWALRRSQNTKARRWHWPTAGLVLGLVFLYAVTDEIHQAFVPGRTGQMSDVMIDTAGGAIGLGLLWLAGKTCKRLQGAAPAASAKVGTGGERGN